LFRASDFFRYVSRQFRGGAIERPAEEHNSGQRMAKEETVGIPRCRDGTAPERHVSASSSKTSTKSSPIPRVACARNRIRVLDAGDKVLVEMTPYDLTKGRITYRFK